MKSPHTHTIDQHTCNAAGARIVSFLGVIALLTILTSTLIFPAYKQNYLGYLPIATGLFLFSYILKFRHITLIHALKMPKSKTMLSYKDYLFLLVIILIPSALQIILVCLYHPKPLFDGLYVYNEALHYSQTGSLSPFTYYPPAQTLWYTLFFHLFSPSYLTAQLSHIPLNCVVIITTFYLGRLCMPLRYAKLATVCVACYPTQILYILTTPYYFYMYESMILLWATLLIYSLTSRHVERSSFFASLVAAWGALSKAVFLISPGITFLFLFIVKRYDIRELCKGFLFFMLGFILVLLPWNIRNYSIFDQPVFVCTSGGLVLYSANNEFSNGLYSNIPEQGTPPDPKAFLSYSKICAQKAIEFIVNNPLSYMQLSLKKILITWGNETTYTELFNYKGRMLYKHVGMAYDFVIQCGWIIAVMLALSRGLFFLKRNSMRITPLDMLFSLLIISHIFVHIIYEGGARHHLPLIPFFFLYGLQPTPCRDKHHINLYSTICGTD